MCATSKDFVGDQIGDGLSLKQVEMTTPCAKNFVIV